MVVQTEGEKTGLSIFGEKRRDGGEEQMVRSCLGDSCLVKSDAERRRQIQTER